ncbi:hypothetical protein CYMTET_41747, partial [Cymbomonas tetramitiformis]
MDIAIEKTLNRVHRLLPHAIESPNDAGQTSEIVEKQLHALSSLEEIAEDFHACELVKVIRHTLASALEDSLPEALGAAAATDAGDAPALASAAADTLQNSHQFRTARQQLLTDAAAAVQQLLLRKRQPNSDLEKEGAHREPESLSAPSLGGDSAPPNSDSDLSDDELLGQGEVARMATLLHEPAERSKALQMLENIGFVEVVGSHSWPQVVEGLKAMLDDAEPTIVKQTVALHGALLGTCCEEAPVQIGHLYLNLANHLEAVFAAGKMLRVTQFSLDDAATRHILRQ